MPRIDREADCYRRPAEGSSSRLKQRLTVAGVLYPGPFSPGKRRRGWMVSRPSEPGATISSQRPNLSIYLWTGPKLEAPGCTREFGTLWKTQGNHIYFNWMKGYLHTASAHSTYKRLPQRIHFSLQPPLLPVQCLSLFARHRGWGTGANL